MPYPLGTKIGAPLTNGDAAAKFGTHIDYLGVGGFRSVTSIADRDAIPVKETIEYDGIGSGQRREGMVVYCSDTKKTYQLQITGYANLTDIDKLANLSNNSNWKAIEFGVVVDGEYIKDVVYNVVTHTLTIITNITTRTLVLSADAQDSLTPASNTKAPTVDAVNAGLALVQGNVDSVNIRIDTLVTGAPAALDTLKEIADQIAADENGVAGILATQQSHTAQINEKADKSYVDTKDALKADKVSLAWFAIDDDQSTGNIRRDATNLNNDYGYFVTGCKYGYNCSDNVWGGFQNYNEYGDFFQNNTFGSHIENCRFGTNNSHHNFSSSITNVVFGINSGYNTVGDNCSNIIVGDGCSRVTFPSDLINVQVYNTSNFTVPAGVNNVTYRDGVRERTIKLINGIAADDNGNVTITVGSPAVTVVQNLTSNSTTSVPSVKAVKDAIAAGSSTGADVNKAYVDAADATKVDKVSGKQLTTEDYTSAEKAKLSGLNNTVIEQNITSNSTTSVPSVAAVNAAITSVSNAIGSTDLYNVPQAVREAVVMGTYNDSSELTQVVANSVAGMRFSYLSYNYEYLPGDGGSLVWVRNFKKGSVTTTGLIAVRSSTTVTFERDAEYNPISSGTFTVDNSTKVIGSVVSIYLAPSASQPTIPTTGYKLISGAYVAGTNMMYMFKVGANNQIQYSITNTD